MTNLFSLKKSFFIAFHYPGQSRYIARSATVYGGQRETCILYRSRALRSVITDLRTCVYIDASTTGEITGEQIFTALTPDSLRTILRHAVFY